MLRWMCGKTRRNKIRNERIHKIIEITLIKEKIRENRLRWFDHIQGRPIIVKKSDAIHIRVNARGCGRPKLT